MSAKITADMLVFIISTFCGIKDPNISKQTKLDCMDMMVNCTIVEDGFSTNQMVNICKDRWSEIENRRRRENRR